MNNYERMREALEVARKALDFCVLTHINDTRIEHVIGQVDAALSEPARNCDRFQVAAEALQEWQLLVKAKPNTWDFRYNYWLFAPAAERKGANDGR